MQIFVSTLFNQKLILCVLFASLGNFVSSTAISSTFENQPTMGAESLNQQLDLMIRTSVNSRESFELGLVWNY